MQKNHRPDRTTYGRLSCSSIGINAVGIIRAPQGDGKESIVLITPYNSVNMSHDSQHGEYASVAAWLRDYHTPLFGGLAKVNAEMCHESSYLYDLKQSPATGAEVSDVFRRAGTMAAALVIKVADRIGEVERGTLRIYAEASNGQMPNLDLVNIVNYLAVHEQGLRVKVKKLWSLLDSKCGLRLVEGVIRSVNNLLEKFHQSFFLYLLTSPSKFVSVGVYMIAFALLVAPLSMVAAYLYSDAHKQEFSSEKEKLTSSTTSTDVPAITFKSWKWFHAAKTVFVVHIWSVIVTLLPYFISQMPNCTPTNNLLCGFCFQRSAFLPCAWVPSYQLLVFLNFKKRNGPS
ncbi:GPI transamidase component family protein [Actinidia rufa]|uniref:GPI transamidase component family protein n=1 Tax=Actinidia rufa TaxID=165716 RepID=A0A7J0DGA7_9ERIC|nr:GPI transamidase component family protein [Actinidia rufa]